MPCNIRTPRHKSAHDRRCRMSMATRQGHVEAVMEAPRHHGRAEWHAAQKRATNQPLFLGRARTCLRVASEPPVHRACSYSQRRPPRLFIPPTFLFPRAASDMRGGVSRGDRRRWRRGWTWMVRSSAAAEARAALDASGPCHTFSSLDERGRGDGSGEGRAGVVVWKMGNGQAICLMRTAWWRSRLRRTTRMGGPWKG